MNAKADIVWVLHGEPPSYLVQLLTQPRLDIVNGLQLAKHLSLF